jgi:hypothetical protein
MRREFTRLGLQVHRFSHHTQQMALESVYIIVKVVLKLIIMVFGTCSER